VGGWVCGGGAGRAGERRCGGGGVAGVEAWWPGGGGWEVGGSGADCGMGGR